MQVPALVLWGAEDRFAGASMATRFGESLADATVQIIPDVGHFVWGDAPEATTAATGAFLTAGAA
jgi:pimeloyl-ACP methyl ester carboxylesterase